MATPDVAKRDSMDASASALSAKMAAASVSTPRKRPLGLTDLPPSVRNNIYKHCLDTELVNVGKPNVSYTHKISDGVLTFSASRQPFPVTTALFYVNKTISKEALRYFYEKNLWVRLDVYTADARHAKTLLEDSGLLFSTASAEAVEKSVQHALEVVLVEKNSAQKRASIMFPAQYLPRLINFLDQASRAAKTTWAPSHTLFLTVVNTYALSVSKLQGDLLELFRLLSNFGGVTVDSKNLLPRYAEGLQSMMTEKEFSADAWLARVTELADLADEKRDKEEYGLANEYAQATVIALTYGYLTHAETLHSQDDAFNKKVQRVRWRTELGLGISLSIPLRGITSTKHWVRTQNPSVEVRMAARDLLLAESSVSKALSLVMDSPSPTSNPWFLSLPVELIPPNKPTFFTEREKAQTWYALGTVHLAIGENIFACGDFERALEHWGKDSGIDEEGGLRGRIEETFEKARQGIDGDAESMWVGDVRPGTMLKMAAKLAKGL